MSEKGYASAAQIVSEKHTVVPARTGVGTQLTSLELFQRFTLPKTEKNLQGQVKSAETSLGNETLRLQRQLERFKLLQKQVDRAPFARLTTVFCSTTKSQSSGQAAPIDEGMAVRQRQPLFYLPDLSEMEVQVAVNESVVAPSRSGPTCIHHFRGDSQTCFDRTGCFRSARFRLVSRCRSGDDMTSHPWTPAFDFSVTHRQARRGHRPAQARHEHDGRFRALATRKRAGDPASSGPDPTVGKRSAYVAHDETLERRVVKIGQDTAEMVEVLDGLQEGEMVALDPPGATTNVEHLLSFDEPDSSA